MGTERGPLTPFPGEFRVASPFGLRTDPVTGEENAWHGGVDLVGPDPASIIRASVGGTVLRSRMVANDGSGGRTWEWGNYISVLGDDGIVIYYCHLAKRLVSAGERVEAGQKIGIQGSTGRSLGNHLHFEARREGIQIDPCLYLGIPNEAGFEYRCAEEAEEAEETEESEAADGAEEMELADGKAAENTDGGGGSVPWEEQASPWARESVGRMIGRGILLGRGGGDYALGDTVTREEVCVMIDRAMKGKAE